MYFMAVNIVKHDVVILNDSRICIVLTGFLN